MDAIRQQIRVIRRMIGITVTICLLVVILFFIWVPLEEKLSATGSVIAEKECFIYAADEGRVQEVVAKDGTDLKEGDPILKLDSTDMLGWRSQLEAEIKEAQASLEFKQAQTEKISKLPLPKEFWHVRSEVSEARQKTLFAEKELKRYQTLFDEQLTSQSELDARKLAFDSAHAELERAEERLGIVDQGLEESIKKEALTDLKSAITRVERLKVDMRVCEDRIARCVVRTPLSGKLTLLLKRREGEGVAKGEELAHLSSGGASRARLLVNENQIHRVRIGQKVRMRSNMFESMRLGYIWGNVTEVSNEPSLLPSSEGQRQFRVLVQIQQSPIPLVLGTTLHAKIILQKVPFWKRFFFE